jgi:hypothetical protein
VPLSVMLPSHRWRSLTAYSAQASVPAFAIRMNLLSSTKRVNFEGTPVPFVSTRMPNTSANKRTDFRVFAAISVRNVDASPDYGLVMWRCEATLVARRVVFKALNRSTAVTSAIHCLCTVRLQIVWLLPC